MDPYTQAAFGFAKAYQMNMQAADEQRRANQPSSNAFAQGVDNEEVDYSFSRSTQMPTVPTEESSGIPMDGGSALDRANGSSIARAKRKASKYLQAG